MNEKPYPAPKSICQCGHNGDGPDSNHGGLLGHGACNMPGCDCKKFMWKKFLIGFEDWVKRQP